MHQQPVYQQQPVVPQQNQQGLHAGLTVTRPEDQAALLTTSLQQPQQQLAQPVAQHNYMLPPGMSTTTTIPPPAMHGIAHHPPPLQPFQTVQQQQGVSAANGQFMQVPINAQQQQFQEEQGATEQQQTKSGYVERARWGSGIILTAAAGHSALEGSNLSQKSVSSLLYKKVVFAYIFTDSWALRI